MNLKKILIKTICFITGAEWRKFFPEEWDLSEIYVWEEYGGNEGFISFYKDFKRARRFVHGIDIQFYDNSWKIKSIIGYTRGSICSIAINKRLLRKQLKDES